MIHQYNVFSITIPFTKHIVANLKITTLGLRLTKVKSFDIWLTNKIHKQNNIEKISFNLNDYKSYDQEIYNRNLPIWKSYEPGSTFKLVTASAALEEKITDKELYIYQDIADKYKEREKNNNLRGVYYVKKV